MKKQLRHIKEFFTTFKRDEAGSVAVYVAGFAAIGLGMSAIAIDLGRATVLQSQMQNRADAGAMAGAAQLDGRTGARDRAAQMAMNAITQYSSFANGGSNLDVQSVNFYQQIEPEYIAADSDENAKFIQVAMSEKTVDFIFAPSSYAETSSTSATLSAKAVAQPDPYMCHAPPLMICDIGETNPMIDMSSTDIVGRMVVLKPPQGGEYWAPGNYGLLALPDGSIGASSLEAALAAVQPEECYGLEVGTAPGVKTSKVQNGINARFDYETTKKYPAPNVISYPRDEDVLSGSVSFGNGAWDISAYWAEKHSGPMPDALIGATRYQTYLYELGETFARNGKLTHYPIGDAGVPEGYDLVEPYGADIPTSSSYPNDPAYDGAPASQIASNGYARRLVQVAVLQCISEGVKGSHNYPTNGQYLEMFLTEYVPDAPAGGIYGEIVRPLSMTTTPDFHANVKLVK